MANPLAPFAEGAYALLRIVSGALFAFHGVQKVVRRPDRAPAAARVADLDRRVIELACGTAIALGCFTSLAAFLASGTMAVAYFQFHWKFQFGSAFFPAVNQGELAVVYCFLFLYLACKGSGCCSLRTGRPPS